MAFSPGRLAEAFEQCLRDIGRPASGLCVALSGGLDSTVLVTALARLRDERGLPPLRAVHVNHGLHADAGDWADACTRLGATLGVPCELVEVNARHEPGESPEAAARAARYAALAGRLRASEMLLTAHHADDQLEGILLQWLRGGGLRAVAGMARVAPFAAGWHARPLLGFTREELREWGTRTGVAWLEDPSNLDTRFDRNYLRLEVLPAIRRRWPAAARTVGRVAGQAMEALELESLLASADLAAVSRGAALSLDGLAALPQSRQRLVLRAWLRGLGLPVPSERTLGALRHDMLCSADDRVPSVDWPGARVHRYRRHLHASKRADTGLRVPSGEWHAGAAFDLGALGRLELVPASGAGLRRAGLPTVLHVGARHGGEVFRESGSAHRRPLRKWLQEHGVLPWRRMQLPIVSAGGEIIAVGDIAYGETHTARPGEPSWRIVWTGRPALTEADVLGRVEVAGGGPLR